MIKFNKFNVTNGIHKARVSYSHATLIGGREAITLYAKDCINDLHKIFGGAEYENGTDTLSDYFETGRVRLFPGHPLFAAALERC